MSAQGPGRQERDEAGRSAAFRGRSSQQTARRRRFVGDDAVVVEHQSLGRPGQKRTLSRLASTTEAGQEMERLKQGLERERRRARDAEAELGGLKDRVRAANTQMTHLRLQVEEGRKALQQQEEDILHLRAELHRVREEARKRPAPVGRPRKEPVVTSPQDADENGQEPVKWWKD